MKKNKKLKSINYGNTDVKEIKTLVIITTIIVVLAAGLYFLTEGALQRQKNKDEELPEAVINLNETIIGQMFNKPVKEYYVFAFSNDDDNSMRYNALIGTHERKDDSIPIYFIDLSIGFNSFALNETANPNPRNATEVAINEKALFLIRDGRVVNFYDDIDDIQKTLS